MLDRKTRFALGWLIATSWACMFGGSEAPTPPVLPGPAPSGGPVPGLPGGKEPAPPVAPVPGLPGGPLPPPPVGGGPPPLPAAGEPLSVPASFGVPECDRYAQIACGCSNTIFRPTLCESARVAFDAWRHALATLPSARNEIVQACTQLADTFAEQCP
jgi:hypothetical protein